MSKICFALFITICAPFMGVAKSLESEENRCTLGAQIRRFDTLSMKGSEEKLLRALVSDPVFALDEPKYLKALEALVAIPSATKLARAQIEAFLEAPIPKGRPSQFRERRAEALVGLLSLKTPFLSEKKRAAIEKKLLVELPETLAASSRNADGLGVDDWLRRIEVLSEKNQNDRVIAEILAREKSLRKQLQWSCRVQFLLGKGFRKARRYQDARTVLAPVSEQCEGANGIDAAFLLARLAAISPRPENMHYFESFEEKYPHHSYLDDVLIFKASALESLHQIDAAKAVLQRVADEEEGDQKADGAFRLAFIEANEGHVALAIKILEGMASQDERAKYWAARLRLYPDPSTLKKSPDFKKEQKAKEQLVELARGPGSFYSWLATLLLEDMGMKPVQVTPQKNNAAKAPDLALSQTFETLFCMIAHGDEAEARRIVETLDPGEWSDTERLNIAYRFHAIGLEAEAFRFMQGTQSQDWKMLYPRAHASAVANASKKVGVSENLIYGIMREESRFDERVISWAGARGALQLMPAVAREEALKFKIEKLSDEAMLDPNINVLLGAEHLRGMLATLGHPVLAVAAYNAGVAPVKSWQQKLAKTAAVDAFVENIPYPETRAYVKRVVSAWVRYAELYPSQDKLFGIQMGSTLAQH